MSTTDNPPPADTGPRVSGEEARDLGRLRRTTKASPEGRHIAGVAGGIARHFDIDPVIVRVVLVVLVFFGGAGLLLYGAGWLFVPEEGTERSVVGLDDRNRSLALYVAAALAALALLGDTLGRWDFPWPLAIIALVVLVLLGRRDQRRTRAGAGTTAYDPTAYGTAYGPTYGPAAYGAPTDTAAWTPPADTAGGAPAWTPPTPGPAYVPAPNPRKRGPILFWFTLALIALLEGVLGIVDAAGASIAGPAYPALAVGVTGAMLVLGAFWGRAGGLILVGLVSTFALVLSVAGTEYDDNEHRVHATPRLASEVKDKYDINTGELVLDLRDVTDPAGLDDRDIDLEGGVGKLTVVVPDGWGVGVDAHVGIGNIRILDSGENGGLGVDYSAHRSASDANQPVIQLDVNLGVGSIEVLDEDDSRAGSIR